MSCGHDHVNQHSHCENCGEYIRRNRITNAEAEELLYEMGDCNPHPIPHGVGCSLALPFAWVTLPPETLPDENVALADLEWDYERILAGFSSPRLVRHRWVSA